MDQPEESGRSTIECALARDLAEAALRGRNCAEAADNLLKALCGSGRLAAAMVQIHGESPFRCVVGDATRLAATTGIEPRTTHVLDGGRVVHLPLSTSECPRSVLTLASDQPLADDFVRLVSAQVSLALDRAYLCEHAARLGMEAERPMRAVAAIYEIGGAIDREEIEPLFALITQRAAKVMDAQACSLMRLDPDTKQLTIAGSFGLSEEIIRVTQQALGEGIAGRVAQSGEPIRIADSQQVPGLSLRYDIGSSMVVPMKDEQGQVLGVLCIRRRRPAPVFTDDDQRLFSIFAAQAALAISNKQLYDDLRRRVRQLSTLAHLTEAVITHVDVASLLEIVADSIVDVVKFDRCCIYVLDRSSKRFVPRVVRGYRPEAVTRIAGRFGEGVVGIVASKRMPIIEHDARHAMQPLRGFARTLGANAFLAVPMLAKGQAIGVVVADNKLTGRPIPPDSLDLLTMFVSHVGLAVENAQLHEDREQRYQETIRLATQTDNILRSIDASVTVVDAAGYVTRWNKASEDLWGLPEHQTIHRRYDEIVSEFGLPRDEQETLAGLMARALETGDAQHAYRMALHPEGKSDLSVNVLLSPVIDRQGQRQGAVQVIEDVTDAVRAEQEMARMRRLADIGQLAAKMAHEVRNPLSSIKGAAQLMRNEAGSNGSLGEFLDIIIDEVNGLSRITTDLLDFARPMHREVQAVSLAELVQRTLHLLGDQLAGARVEVIVRAADDLPQIEVDARQIEQVMRNLVINAVQAMPDGGRLVVEVDRADGADGLCVRFTDSGVGVRPDRLKDIFQPFFTTKTKGTGLGLSIVQKIIENHGGSVECEQSTPGVGTTFCMTLPLHPPIEETGRDAAAGEEIASPIALPDM